MAKEIERKFLVNPGWEKYVDGSGTEFSQAYLNTDPRATVRVRLAGDRAWLTVKGKNEGTVRDEWEYAVPADDAAEMIARCGQAALAKTRYRAGRWEIDCYHGPLEGLTVAEIELTSADEPFERPAWLGREVSDDPRYFNSCLALAGRIPE